MNAPAHALRVGTASAFVALAAFACNTILATPDPMLRIDAGQVTYGDLTDVRRWEAFDLALPENFGPNAMVFSGGSFDGRYVYLAPSSNYAGTFFNTLVARYDSASTKGLDDRSAWAVVDLKNAPELGSVHGSSFFGSASDGRAVYLIPSRRQDGGVAARYDKNAPFEDAASWTGFDLVANLGLTAKSFAGGAVVGKYLYLAPSISSGAVRYDTSQPFENAESWNLYDLTKIGAGDVEYFGVATDGKYVYYVPNVNKSAGLPSGVIARFDTAQTDFGHGWQTYDLVNVPGKPAGFLGAVFDGRYLYFVPNYDRAGIATRFDTAAAFDAPSSWQTFYLGKIDGVDAAVGYAGGQFDGRYVYFVPQYEIDVNGTIVRYDTMAPFGSATSYRAFDITRIHPKAAGFVGSVFDGRYVYLVPSYGGVVARFDARTPAALPSPGSSY
ncbi:MAG TPA: hypothetical protein VNO21_16710 [Polyangiaceae bacterium]|nr:hypothetical protein [Polyangiaceae bacterium]